MTDAQIYSSYCKAHKKLCELPCIQSEQIASAILLSLVHSHLHQEVFNNPSEQDFKSIDQVSVICDLPSEEIRNTYSSIPQEMLNLLRKTISYWGINFDLYESVFGSLFEKYITKKESGAYYTAPITTEYISLKSICSFLLLDIIPSDTLKVIWAQPDTFEWFREAVNILTDAQREQVVSRLRTVSILDPTCGTGAFVVQAFKVLLKIYPLLSIEVDSNIIEHIINNNLYGVDIDPEAIVIVKFRFLVLAQSFGVTKIKSLPNFKIGNTINNAEFDWSREFANGGKFDIILGNPPYVETTKEQRATFDDDLSTSKCGNLYACVMEKSITRLLKDKGVLGMIVPISIASTTRMAPLRQVIYDNSAECFYSHYADRPGCLFIGVHQKLTICIMVKGETAAKVYTSSYHHWDKEQEQTLFRRVKPHLLTVEDPTDIIPKIGSDIEDSILDKVAKPSRANVLDDTVVSSDNNVWLNMRMCFWAKAFTVPQKSNEYKKFSFPSEKLAKAFSALLNSSLFFFLWEAMSDCWHITSKDLQRLNFSFSSFPSSLIDRLAKLATYFEAELERTKKFIGSKQTDYIYQHKYHKDPIDKIDDTLATALGFNKAELDFIKNYQALYRLNTAHRTPMNVIDIFSGVGGLSLGFERAGYNVLIANEIDPEIAFSYRCNHPNTLMLNCDITEFADNVEACINRYGGLMGHTRLAELQEGLQNISVVIGGPPCQGFSMAGERIRHSKSLIEDPRNFLFKQYFRIIQKYEPKYFVFENVVGLLSSHKGEIIKAIKDFFQDPTNFQAGGYHLNIKVFDASDFGIPQARKRVLIIGSKQPFDLDQAIKETISSLDPELKERFTRKTTVRDAIYDIASRTGDSSIPNHEPTAHSAKAIERMSKILPNQNFTSLDEDIKSIHSGSYGRLDWDKPSTTITTRFDTPSAGRYIHPEANRTITQREAARLQTFPDDFIFRGSKSSICKQIGNAVPPQLAEFIARMILHIENSHYADRAETE